MREYVENGAALGWLIDPLERKVHVYRPDKETEILDDPKQVSGEPFLKKFSLNVRKLW
jgi:Uma2 family endonuclease